VRRAALLLLATAAACVIGKRPVELPDTEDAVVLVGSAALPPPMDGIARHPWVALREAGSAQWERWEVLCCPDSSPLSTVSRSTISPLSDYGGGGGDVRLHGVWTGARAERAIECIRREAPRYPHRNRYRAWPGPNSNTFVDYMMRRCRLRADLPAPSIGKDYRGLIGASRTAGGTGLQLETPVVGIKVGLTEGIEVHILGLAIGVDLWPPAIIVPVGPGRIGFDDR
jgi:hypothetical protein